MRRLLFLVLLAIALVGALLAVNGWIGASAARAQASQPAEEEPLEVFVPTEKVRADNSISFPVDI